MISALVTIILIIIDNDGEMLYCCNFDCLSNISLQGLFQYIDQNTSLSSSFRTEVR